ncbi:hypothetical protein DFJ58DRAFT_837784 [Suillus subalutaceus]|uniref:uncharacterized protein n=1 Tax=Suillus subalutaceus TaxID=48586 RepID=UPI001B8781BF|nr:uncharacterized protein DFJ58DRAFT_837784 [Suillus subalutaceus]KAG1868946.1 hypothetical protein DFJ58DRAFT_837784 [Suillus subalutaceus]
MVECKIGQWVLVPLIAIFLNSNRYSKAIRRTSTSVRLLPRKQPVVQTKKPITLVRLHIIFGVKPALTVAVVYAIHRSSRLARGWFWFLPSTGRTQQPERQDGAGTMCPPDEVTPEQELAADLFSNYLGHLSLDRYAAALQEQLSSEHTASIQEYMDAMKASDTSSGDALDKLHEDFLRQIVAIEARKEAGQTRKDLLY